MLHGCVEVALLEWLHVVHLLHEVDIVLPTETTKLKLFKTLKLLLNVNSLHGISGATTSTIKTSSSTDFCNTSFNFHRNRVVQFNLQQLVGLAVDACAITNKRWRLLSAQLSNKFGYCHLWTVSIILAFDKHNSIPLGPSSHLTIELSALAFSIGWTPNSVTRLRQFLQVLCNKLSHKSSLNILETFGLFQSCHYYIKSVCGHFLGQFSGTIGQLFIPSSGHTDKITVLRLWIPTNVTSSMGRPIVLATLRIVFSASSVNFRWNLSNFRVSEE